MIPLIDYGAIADLRKKMVASQAPQGQPELQPMPQVPIQAPLLAPAPPNQMLPVAEPRVVGAPPTPKKGLLYAQNPPEYDGMFNDAELNAARPGKVQSLLGRLIGESPQNIMRSNLDVMTRRKLVAQGYADKEAARQDATSLRDQLSALRQEAAASGMPFDEFARRLVMLRPELASQIAQMVGVMKPEVQQGPKSVPDGSWVPDGKGGWVQLGGKGAVGYEERPERGGIAIYENGQFKSWKIRPPAERDVSVGQALDAQRQYTREQGLAGDFRQEQEIKDAKGVAGAVSTIRGALSKNTPQSDLAAVYALVKLYDPNSVVREGEIKLVQSATSLPDQVRLMWEQWNKGRKLLPHQRKAVMEIADSIVEERHNQIAPILADYGAAASRWGVDSTRVAPDPFRRVRGTGSSGKPEDTANESDADMWERLVRSGVSRDEATRQVKARKK